MMTHEQIDVMRQDAQLALSDGYGYPVARLYCAHHVMALIVEIDRLQASLAASTGDFTALRRLAEEGD
jgi:hypothetical protein